MLALTSNSYFSYCDLNPVFSSHSLRKAANEEPPGNHGNPSTCCALDARLRQLFLPVLVTRRSPADIKSSSGDLESIVYPSGNIKQKNLQTFPDVLA